MESLASQLECNDKEPISVLTTTTTKEADSEIYEPVRLSGDELDSLIVWIDSVLDK